MNNGDRVAPGSVGLNGRPSPCASNTQESGYQGSDDQFEGYVHQGLGRIFYRGLRAIRHHSAIKASQLHKALDISHRVVGTALSKLEANDKLAINHFATLTGVNLLMPELEKEFTELKARLYWIQQDIRKYQTTKSEQIVMGSFDTAQAFVYPKDPHKRLFIDRLFFCQTLHLQVATLIHELSHFQHTQDYWYLLSKNNAQSLSEFIDNYSIYLEEGIVVKLEQKHLNTDGNYRQKLTKKSGGIHLVDALNKFNSDVRVKAAITFRNADSVAGIAIALAVNAFF